MKGLLETPASSLAHNSPPLHFPRGPTINTAQQNIPFVYLELGRKRLLSIISK